MWNYTITNTTDVDTKQLKQTIDAIFTYLCHSEFDGERVKEKKCVFHIVRDVSELDGRQFSKVKNLSAQDMAGACFIYYGSYHIFLFHNKIVEESVLTSNDAIRMEQTDLKYSYYLADEIRHVYQHCIVGHDKTYRTLTHIGNTRVHKEMLQKQKEKGAPHVPSPSFFEQDATNFAFEFLLRTYGEEISEPLYSQLERDIHSNKVDFHEDLEELKRYSNKFFAQNSAIVAVGSIMFFVLLYLFFFF